MAVKILVLNGSLGGEGGNTALALRRLLLHFESFDVETLHLRDLQNTTWPRELVLQKLHESDGFVFATGTYWDSWGSPLQNFFEKATEFEATSCWLGKPALCLVTMHSVGGKEVLSRLQGVLSTWCLALPPMSGMAYSMISHSLVKATPPESKIDADIWTLDDFKMMAQNFLLTLEALRHHRSQFAAWPVDARDPSLNLWLKE